LVAVPVAPVQVQVPLLRWFAVELVVLHLTQNWQWRELVVKGYSIVGVEVDLGIGRRGRMGMGLVQIVAFLGLNGIQKGIIKLLNFLKSLLIEGNSGQIEALVGNWMCLWHFGRQGTLRIKTTKTNGYI
jgi:hypothetical protein